MKRQHARTLCTELRAALPEQSYWSVASPVYTQNGRRINHYFYLKHPYPESADLPPLLPASVHETLNAHDIHDRHLEQHILEPGEDTTSSGQSLGRRYFNDERDYIILIDNNQHEMLPKTGEDKRIEELAQDIRHAINIGKSAESTAENLAAEYETVEEVLTAPRDELETIAGVGPATLEHIMKRRSPGLAHRLKEYDGDVLIVEQNDEGTYEPVYKPPENAEKQNRRLVRNL